RRLDPAFRLLEERLARQTHAALAVDVRDHHVDLVAELHHVLDRVHALVGEVADVAEAVGARHDLEERAVGLHALDDALVGLADLGLGGEAADDVDRLLGLDRIARRDVHGAVVLDVDLRARLLDDALDGLAAGPDDDADLLGLDLDARDAGRVLAQLRAGRR